MWAAAINEDPVDSSSPVRNLSSIDPFTYLMHLSDTC